MITEKKTAQLPRHLSFGWLVAVLGGQMANALEEELKGLDLNITLWPTLFALWEEEGLSQAELATRCQTANYTTTRVIDALEKLELVERRKHPTSRRSYQIFLTPKGRELETPCATIATTVNDSFLSALTDDERQQMLTLISKIIASKSKYALPES